MIIKHHASHMMSYDSKQGRKRGIHYDLSYTQSRRGFLLDMTSNDFCCHYPVHRSIHHGRLENLFKKFPKNNNSNAKQCKYNHTPTPPKHLHRQLTLNNFDLIKPCPITSWHLSCFKLLSETQSGKKQRESSAMAFYRLFKLKFLCHNQFTFLFYPSITT